MADNTTDSVEAHSAYQADTSFSNDDVEIPDAGDLSGQNLIEL
jgi:hypothetical protein